LKVNRYINARAVIPVCAMPTAQTREPRANFVERRACEHLSTPGAGVYFDQLIYDRRVFEYRARSPLDHPCDAGVGLPAANERRRWQRVNYVAYRAKLYY